MTKNLLVELGLEEMPAYVVTPSMKQLRDLLFADWRIEETAFCALDTQLLLQLAPRYRRKSLHILCKLLEKRK